MASQREKEINEVYKRVKQRIPISSAAYDQSALRALKPRLKQIAIEDETGAKLFDEGLLNLCSLDEAKTLEDVANVVDNYLRVVKFYKQHGEAFAKISKMAWFRDKVINGELDYWLALIDDPTDYSSLREDEFHHHLAIKVVDVFSHLAHQSHLPSPAANTVPTEPNKANKEATVILEPIQPVLTTAPIPSVLPTMVADPDLHLPAQHTGRVDKPALVAQEMQKIKIELEEQNQIDSQLLMISRQLLEAVHNKTFWRQRVHQFIFCACMSGNQRGDKVPTGIHNMIDKLDKLVDVKQDEVPLTVPLAKQIVTVCGEAAAARINTHSLLSDRKRETQQFYENVAGITSLLSSGVALEEKLTRLRQLSQLLQNYIENPEQRAAMGMHL